MAVLALRGHQSRGVLAGLLWPDHPEGRARASLRTALRQLRRQLGTAVEVGRDDVALSESVTVDLDRLRATLDLVEEAPDELDVRGAPALRVLRSPDLLVGWYDDWVLTEREQLRHRRVRALMTLARRGIESGDAASSTEFAHQAVELEPLLESATSLYVRALLLDGDLTAAVAEYQRFRDRLRVELGIAPPDGLTELVRKAMASRSARGTGRLPRAPRVTPAGHARRRR